MKWTEEQSKVINSRTGNLLVAAAAGSGKTAVLVERIIEMVLGTDSSGNKISDGIDIDELLVVTFTKAAANQMKEKIADVLSKKAEEMPYNEHLVKQLALLGRAEITTIDSFCLGIVKDYFNVVNIDSNFDIADGPEMELIKADVMNDIMEECYEEASDEFIQLVNAFSRKESDRTITEMVEKLYKVSSSFPRPELWLDNARDALLIKDAEELTSLGWYKAYEESVRYAIESSLIMAEQCIEICDEPDGPIGYRKAIETDAAMFEHMKEQNSLTEIKACYSGFVNIGRNKKDSCDEKLAGDVKNIRSKYKDLIDKLISDIKPLDIVLKETKFMGRPLAALVDLTKKYRNRLNLVKRQKNVYEFHDIEKLALEIVCEGYDEDGVAVPSSIGKIISQKYKEILIDEYQDSNFLQEDILKCVSGCGKNINNTFMVGDIKQSIYRFRMARPDLFLEKYSTYSEEIDESDCRKILLSNNFRSSKSILDAVNMIFAPLMSKDIGGIEYDTSAFLKPGPEQLAASSDDLKPELYLIGNNTKETEKDNTEIEAITIANKIDEIVNGNEPLFIRDDKSPEGKRKVNYRDIVILLRSVKSSALVYDQVFSERGIPVYLESEQGYFDAIEVNTLLSMLAVVDNVYLDYDMAAVLRSPLVGLNEEQLAHIVGIYNQHMKQQKNENALKNGMLYDKIVYYTELGLENDINSKLTSFLDMLRHLKSEKNYMSISDMIRYILDETGYYWFVAAMGMGRRRQANIDMLINKADAYEESSFKGLFNFLRYIDRLKVNDIDFAEAGVLSDNEDTVRIMTMHKSKGLEFPVVFVSGLGKQLTNMDAKSAVIIHPDYYLASHAIDIKNRVKQNTFAKNAIIYAQKTEMYAEEMRVLYVALTRAKQKLYMTGCVNDVDKTLEKCEGIVTETGKLLFVDKLASSNFMEWILMSHTAGNGAEDLIERHFGNGIDILAEDYKLAAIKAISVPDNEDDISDSIICEDAKKALSFSYAYGLDNYKSKMSITEIKKLQSEGEENPGVVLYKAKEDNEDIPVPDFMTDKKVIHGNELGTVMHKIMELIDFQKADMQEIDRQVDIMFDKKIFADEFRPYIQTKKLYYMLNSSVGKRMAAADRNKKLFRERQFYISMRPDSIWSEEKRTEEIIVVQGIIDAYFIENGQAVLLDYKTDKVSDMKELVTRYHVQLEKYAETIERLTGYTVKEKIIYSFCLNDEISF
ncbi:MAG: helicase-exonuclease AddAB subunit AddA [Coprococcus sp.]